MNTDTQTATRVGDATIPALRDSGLGESPVRHIRRLVQRPHKLNDYDDMREYAESLEAVLRETVAQLKHVEELRRKDCGPIPATITPSVIRDAEYILLNDQMSGHGPQKENL